MYYTLIIWDPDAVVPAYIHMLIINIPNKRVANGTTILPYTPPAPPPGTGTHRYITALFRQNTPISIKTIKRANFDVANFVNKYHLELVEHKMFTVNS